LAFDFEQRPVLQLFRQLGLKLRRPFRQRLAPARGDVILARDLTRSRGSIARLLGGGQRLARVIMVRLFGLLHRHGPKIETCVILMSAICKNNISAKNGALPVPGDAIVSLPGWDLA